MANYYGMTRTNYFRVTDEDAYAALISRLLGEDEVYDFSKLNEETGDIYHGFGSYSSLDYYKPVEGDDSDEDAEPNFDAFLTGIQQIIHPDDAFILLEVGNEKLRYLVGCACVVTKKAIDCLDLESLAIAKARELLGNPKYDM